MLRVENINTGYGKKQVLFDVSFTVAQSESVLLIGSNGSGKSTVLKAIYGLVPIWNKGVGRIFFEDEDITDLPPSVKLQRGLMYIPQKNNCFDDLTVKENLEMSGLTLKNKQVFQQRLGMVLTQFPMLTPQLRQKPTYLSGGERQLLTLAMAALHQPKLILMDEPFTGLSPVNIGLVKAHIQRLNSEGVGFLIVEHRVKETFSIINKYLGLKLGHLC
jgi:branched-chain amino acid transport system ATP-binding protein